MTSRTGPAPCDILPQAFPAPGFRPPGHVVTARAQRLYCGGVPNMYPSEQWESYR